MHLFSIYNFSISCLSFLCYDLSSTCSTTSLISVSVYQVILQKPLNWLIKIQKSPHAFSTYVLIINVMFDYSLENGFATYKGWLKLQWISKFKINPNEIYIVVFPFESIPLTVNTLSPLFLELFEAILEVIWETLW